MLRAGTLEPEARDRALDAIIRGAVTQSQLVGDLLDVSSIVAGKLRLDVRVVFPAEVVEAALDTVRPAAEARQVRLQAVLDPRAGPVSGDPDRLQQVVWNLLTNAIKFTPRGGRVGRMEDRVRALSAGFDLHLAKPVEPAELVAAIDRLARRRSA